MGKINVLPFAVANLIAAGEVVDRPASVVKELMENAIDAGATRITVEIRNGGVTLMRVTDNGCGMTPEDLPVAIRRHATSKIQKAEDLDGISTLGFRGEALAAIASVSDLRIFSKTKDAPFGAVLESHAGEILGVTEQGCADGTTVIVENLFQNVPARRKFLKKDVTEAMAIAANVERIALSNPHIAVRLISDETVKLDTAGDGNLMNTVYAVFGREFASRLIPVMGENDGISVTGYIGRTDNYKATRNYQNFFINGRYVKSKTAMAALEQAYTSYMPPEKFPCCVLYISIHPGRVDVNVHPAKLEVKFSNEKPVFEAVYYGVRSALESNITRPEMNLGKERAKTVRVSDLTAPINEGRRESVASRQISYDFSGRQQPQPQQRITAAEYRTLVGEPEKTSSEPTGNPLVNKAPAVGPRTQRNPVTTVGNIPYVGRIPSATPGEHLPCTIPESMKAEPEDLPEKGKLPDPGIMADSAIGRAAEIVAPSLEKTMPQAVQAAEPQPRPADPQEPSAPRAEPAAGKTAPIPQPVDEAPGESFSAHPDYRIVGSVFNSYVIVELPDKMLIVDQHAAHERILFEKLKANLKRAETASQMLMLPIDVMLTSAEVEALKTYHDELDQIGFVLRYARNTVSVDAIPQGIEPDGVESALQSMAERIIESTGDVTLTRNIIFEKALYQAACKAAIKAGREYAEGHIEWIIRNLMEIPDITFCPHGRPVAMEISHKKLDKQFDRAGF